MSSRSLPVRSKASVVTTSFHSEYAERGKIVAEEFCGVEIECFALRREDGLRRATFPSSWKSSQKSRKKPMVSSLPCALCCVQDCDCVPHVYAILPFSFRKRIVSAPAPLPLTGAPNSSLCSTVEVVSGSGARRKSIRRGVKKTCRWHVFSPDLGGYAAVADSPLYTRGPFDAVLMQKNLPQETHVS